SGFALVNSAIQRWYSGAGKVAPAPCSCVVAVADHVKSETEKKGRSILGNDWLIRFWNYLSPLLEYQPTSKRVIVTIP
ncbi:MAG: hypothetical protein WB586_28755, partial [Chthoniobacterales bacterium]